MPVVDVQLPLLSCVCTPIESEFPEAKARRRSDWELKVCYVFEDS